MWTIDNLVISLSLVGVIYEVLASCLCDEGLVRDKLTFEPAHCEK